MLGFFDSIALCFCVYTITWGVTQIANGSLNSKRKQEIVSELEKNWTLNMALPLIKVLEAMASRHGLHVALTGGLLYKDGERKDFDLLVYSVRQNEKPHDSFIEFLGELNTTTGLTFLKPYSLTWCNKAALGDRNIDIFYPEAPRNARCACYTEECICEQEVDADAILAFQAFCPEPE